MAAVSKKDLVNLVVMRRTKGAAFNPPPEGYAAYIARVRAEVQADHTTLSLEAFKTKYAIWLV